ncbi:hypothetical protein GMMP1_420006 [Candidatus Magnetomoraceae bacterium gMMP-1]
MPCLLTGPDAILIPANTKKHITTIANTAFFMFSYSFLY